MFRAAISKDSSLLLRDRGALLSLFALPVVFMTAFGSMFQGHKNKAPSGIASPCPEPDSVFSAWAGDGFQLAVPANAVLFGFFLALTMALSFSEERRSGTWQRLLAAPVARWKLLVAKLVPYYAVGAIQMAVLFGIGFLFFDLEVAGSPWALSLLCLAVVWAAVSLGLFFASLSTSERLLGSLGSVSLLVMGILGGTMLPRVAMPELMQTLGLFTPHAWALDAIHDVLLDSSTGVVDVLPSLFVLVGFGILFTVLGAVGFRRLVRA